MKAASAQRILPRGMVTSAQLRAAHSGPAWARVMPRSVLLAGLFAAAGGLGGAACFSGADALGLPCEQDADCGQGQSCDEGFCGGPPTAQCGNGIIEAPETCDDGEANGNDAACKADCSLNVCGDGAQGPEEACDDGNLDDGDGCSASCTVESCGDGKVDAGEECDEGADNANEGSCTEACTDATCGDGFVQEGESCDDAGESSTCNADCSVSMCGDGKVNASAGEGCEPQGGMSSAACMSNCREPLLWEDVEGDVSSTWDSSVVVNGIVPSGWAVTVSESQSGQRSFHTGPPPDGPASWRLVGPPLDLSGLDAEETVTMQIQHWYDFDDCGISDQESDGALVEVVLEDDSAVLVEPVGGYVEVIDNASGCPPDGMNPLEGSAAFSHTNGAFGLQVFDLSSFIGQTVRPSFHVAWDCGECNDGDNLGWYVDDIIVYTGAL